MNIINRYQKTNNYINYGRKDQSNSGDKKELFEKKNDILNYIYKVLELSNYKYKIIECHNDAQQLCNQKYYVSANFSGLNCLLVFIKIKDKYYSYLVDRKTLSYKKYQININDVNIIKFNIMLDMSIYKGSIFDGIYIPNSRKQQFIITDIYYFKGENMCNYKIRDKIKDIITYLEHNYKNKTTNNIELSVNKLYELKDIKQLINKDIPKEKSCIIKGITFYPEISETKLIYLFHKSKQRSNDNKNKTNIQTNSIITTDRTPNANVSNNITSRYVLKDTSNEVEVILEIRDTELVDVYKLFCVETTYNKGKELFKSKRLKGVAYLPTIESSTICKNLLKNNLNKRFFVKCKFINEISKWQPIEASLDSTIPTNINIIESYMNIIED
jgi:hypothetical protein